MSSELGRGGRVLPGPLYGAEPRLRAEGWWVGLVGPLEQLQPRLWHWSAVQRERMWFTYVSRSLAKIMRWCAEFKSSHYSWVWWHGQSKDVKEVYSLVFSWKSYQFSFLNCSNFWIIDSNQWRQLLSFYSDLCRDGIHSFHSPANGGQYCRGQNRRYRTCNTHSCPEDRMDFRKQFCVDNPPNDRYTSWEAVSLGIIQQLLILIGEFFAIFAKFEIR